MNLIDKLPESVYIEGLKYRINSDFRYCLLFEELMNDDEIEDNEKIYLACNLFFENQYIENYIEATEQILWFFRCGKEIIKSKNNNSEKIYSFSEDANYIYSAFMECYGIDLYDSKIHWWKFKSLFDSLSDETLFKKIMSYRAINITENMSKSEKKFYRKMKEIYSLPDNRTEEEKENEFVEALFG